MRIYKDFRVGDIFNFDSSKKIYHAVNLEISEKQEKGMHPYVVRTSQNNGIRGYINEDENGLNPKNTISFAQDTAQMFFQTEPYFTGNKVKVLSVKGRELTEDLALYLITCLNKAFSSYGWGQSYDVRKLIEVPFYLPVKFLPDFDKLSNILKISGGGYRYE